MQATRAPPKKLGSDVRDMWASRSAMQNNDLLVLR